MFCKIEKRTYTLFANYFSYSRWTKIIRKESSHRLIPAPEKGCPFFDENSKSISKSHRKSQRSKLSLRKISRRYHRFSTNRYKLPLLRFLWAISIHHNANFMRRVIVGVQNKKPPKTEIAHPFICEQAFSSFGINLRALSGYEVSGWGWVGERRHLRVNLLKISPFLEAFC